MYLSRFLSRNIILPRGIRYCTNSPLMSTDFPSITFTSSFQKVMYILTRHIFTVKQAVVCRRLSIQFDGICLYHIFGDLIIYLARFLKFFFDIRIRVSFILIYLIITFTAKTKKPGVETLYLCLAVTIELSLIYQPCMKFIYPHIFLLIEA